MNKFFYHLFLFFQTKLMLLLFHNAKRISKTFYPFQTSTEEVLFHPQCMQVLVKVVLTAILIKGNARRIYLMALLKKIYCGRPENIKQCSSLERVQWRKIPISIENYVQNSRVSRNILILSVCAIYSLGSASRIILFFPLQAVVLVRAFTSMKIHPDHGNSYKKINQGLN